MTRRQRLALRCVQYEEGRNWKAHLRTMWERGQYPGYEHWQTELQQLRNVLGPSGLQRLRVKDILV